MDPFQYPGKKMGRDVSRYVWFEDLCFSHVGTSRIAVAGLFLLRWLAGFSHQA